ncbi:MAG: hypothetical protein UZ22_OP11002000818 [Microgenomates bacterium OLB23]|nr:MAG: hypothetical protein UZ22_OP11002000818 [Microgenomates bacterium OLB23]
MPQFFYWKSTLYLDPDLGWELRLGQLIITDGFPRLDPFSYTMPKFPMVAHSWLSDVVFVRIYEVWGIAGVAALTSAALSLVFVVIFGATWHTWTYVPALLLAGNFLPYAGTRPQTFSWLLFAVLLRLLGREAAQKKYRFYIPLLFLIWAQVHGAFFLGLVTYGLYILTNKSSSRVDYGMFAAACCATLLNPYGISLWREVISTFFFTLNAVIC